MRQTSNKNLPGSTGSNKWIQYIYIIIFFFFFFFSSEYGGHSRISDYNLLKQILYHFCASHIPTHKLQHVCYSELLSNYLHDATSMLGNKRLQGK